jgi:hypothetical protein
MIRVISNKKKESTFVIQTTQQENEEADADKIK